MLRIDKLTKRYGAFTAVHDVSFAAMPGEIVGLLGPNGAGKSSIIKCIVSLLLPTSGTVMIDGFDIVTQPKEAKNRLAYVPEIPVTYEMLTVTQHLRFITAAFRVDYQPSQAEAILRRFDLWEKRDSLGGSLSKGMTQKLACACALIHGARMFCLDEPMIGLDPQGGKELKDILRQLRDDGAAVLVSTHQLEVAERLCDRLVVLNKGLVLAQGTLEELQETMCSKDKLNLEEIFLTLTKND